ncbi:GD23210 [Drosophila simulans]|uniref:GD23210 n=1 Tax=Drosophila simulans TaxID=7240 RepID=B4NV08_DROSI|nr:GD23210 [Drosophila simulans]
MLSTAFDCSAHRQEWPVQNESPGRPNLGEYGRVGPTGPYGTTRAVGLSQDHYGPVQPDTGTVRHQYGPNMD